MITSPATGPSTRVGPESRRLGARGLALLLGATAAIGAVTAIIFLVRAGDAGAANWPATWELHSSDNGVLFQVMQDLFAGRRLDWSFSPQVYVFPELPISFLAFVLAGGNVYGYYLLVAVINSSLLFLVFFGLLRLLYPGESAGSSTARAALASLPLLLLPLIGTSWLVSFHLAPTYYFGMYAMVIAAPALFLARSRTTRMLIAAGIALTAASNPLALVFSVPAFGCVLLVRIVRGGFRGILRPVVTTAIMLLVALVIRLTLLAPLQGGSPLDYVDPGVFSGRLAALRPYFEYLVFDPSTRVILTLGAAMAGVCLLGAIVALRSYLTRPGASDDRLLAAAYLGLVPLTGLAATLLVMITHYLYFWLILIAPLSFVLMAIPRGWAERLLPIGAASLVSAAIATGVLSNLAHLDRYFGYRSAETVCLDENLPEGASVGYATFSDARRLSLTSDRPFRLIPLTSDTEPSSWLTNRSYAHDEGGSFFYLNGHGDELPIDATVLTERFGPPDSAFSCGDDQTVFVYTDARALATIAETNHRQDDE